MTSPVITTFTGGLVGTNGYLVEAPGGLVIIDAPAGITDALASDQHAVALLLTHQHFDHVEDVEKLSAQGVPIYAWKSYDPELVLDETARRWGMPVRVSPFSVDRVLAGETTLEVAGLQFSLLHIPGHSPDSICFHLPGEEVVFGGDTLFAGSVGRTDLPGSDPDQFEREIRSKLLTLPDTTRVLPGHGPSTTLAREAASNPFLG